LGKVNVKTDISKYEPPIIIKHNETGKKITYNEYGTMVVTADFFDDIDIDDDEALSARLGELMDIRSNGKENALEKNRIRRS